MDTLAGRIAKRLTERKQTLGVVESSAGGLINAALVAVPGASGFYLGGCIVYTEASRSGLLAPATAAASPAGWSSVKTVTPHRRVVRNTGSPRSFL